MVDLLARALHSVRQPSYDMLGFVGKDLVDEAQPGPHVTLLCHDGGAAILVKHPGPRPPEPTAIGNEAIINQRWLAGCPGHLLDRCVGIEPRAWLDRFVIRTDN